MKVELTIYIAKRDIEKENVLKAIEAILKKHLPQYVELDGIK